MARRRTKSGTSKQFNDFMKRNKVGITALVLIAVVVIAAALWLNNFLCTATCFEVRKIEIVKPGREGSLYVQKEYFNLEYPVNFFTSDALMLSKKIKEAHSEYRIVVITKFLPNRIVATIRDREAVARIKVAKILPVDFEGVIVSETGNLESLPLITGLESQLVNPKAGTRVKSKRLSAALDILQLIYSKREFRNLEMKVIDMTYPDKASFVMDGMTIIIGKTDLDKKIDGLALTLSNPKVDRSKVDSIDLRFTDPAVTFISEKR